MARPDHLKRFLDRLGPLLTEQQLLETRLERLRDQASAPRRSQLTGLPGSPSPTDRTALLATRIADTERELAELSVQVEKVRDQIVSVLDRLPARKKNEFRQQEGLWCRFVECMTTLETAKALYGKRPDFQDRRDGYIRQATRQVHDGLKRLAPVVPDDMIEKQWEETDH